MHTIQTPPTPFSREKGTATHDADIVQTRCASSEQIFVGFLCVCVNGPIWNGLISFVVDTKKKKPPWPGHAWRINRYKNGRFGLDFGSRTRPKVVRHVAKAIETVRLHVSRCTTRSRRQINPTGNGLYIRGIVFRTYNSAGAFFFVFRTLTVPGAAPEPYPGKEGPENYRILFNISLATRLFSTSNSF